MIFIILSIAAIVLLGIITSYEDIRQNKIRNRWISTAISIGIALNVGAIINAHFSSGIDNSYLSTFLLNIGISILAGYLLYHFELWSAGDGKLFIAYSLLVPLDFYQFGFIKYFPSAVLLVNSFVPLAIFLVSKKIGSFPSAMKLMKKEFGFAKTLETIFSLLGVSWLIRLLTQDSIAVYLGTALIALLINKYAKKYPPIISALLFAARLIFDRNLNVLIKDSIILFAVFFFVKAVAKVIVEKYKKETTHFAVYMFIGVLLTLIFKGNILISVKLLLF